MSSVLADVMSFDQIPGLQKREHGNQFLGHIPQIVSHRGASDPDYSSIKLVGGINRSLGYGNCDADVLNGFSTNNREVTTEPLWKGAQYSKIRMDLRVIKTEFETA